MSPRPPNSPPTNIGRSRTNRPLTWPAIDASQLPALPSPDPTSEQDHLKVEVTQFEQRWPAENVEGYDPDDLALQRRYATTLDHDPGPNGPNPNGRAGGPWGDPPEIGDGIEQYVDHALGHELREAAAALKAGYVHWLIAPEWRLERHMDRQCWVKRRYGRGALIRIITDG